MSELEWPCRLIAIGDLCPLCQGPDVPKSQEHRRLVLEAARDDLVHGVAKR